MKKLELNQMEDIAGEGFNWSMFGASIGLSGVCLAVSIVATAATPFAGMAAGLACSAVFAGMAAAGNHN
jgi:riboflavin synthase alpha subunit